MMTEAEKKEHERLYRQEYRKQNREKLRAKARERYACNKDKYRERALAYKAKHIEEIRKHDRENAKKRYHADHEKSIEQSQKKWARRSEKMRAHRVKKRYGITIADRNAMERSQNCCCSICGKEKKLVIDHCHKSGKVRALLCSECNFLVGACGDNPEILWTAIEYVNKYNGLIIETYSYQGA